MIMKDMWILLLHMCFSLLVVGADFDVDHRNDPTEMPEIPRKRKGSFIGDSCQLDCSDIIHAICNRTSFRCQCDPKFPIVVHSALCVTGAKLGEACSHDQSCQYYDRYSVCANLSDSTRRCQCQNNFYSSTTLEPNTQTSICIPRANDPLLTSDVPTLIGVGIGLSVFAGLTCLVLKLFSRARFARARAYGNANLPPPLTPSESKNYPRYSYNKQLSTAESELGIATGPTDSPRPTGSINGLHSSGRNSVHGTRRPSSASLACERTKLNRKDSVNRNDGNKMNHSTGGDSVELQDFNPKLSQVDERY